MSENQSQNKFEISQQYELMSHQKGKAYPISISEWEFIKKKLEKINIKVNDFNKIGFLLLGASVPCLITLIATEFTDVRYKYLVIALFFIFLICGSLSLYFSKEKHETEIAKPTEILNHMKLIESRFESDDKKANA
ncbi:MAG: hypothetical protein CMO82_13890 [Winogradskyella sp.]|nr:hypothetical protein [Winogradskyella sp.]|tara:strand:+ start:622 stop:1029 length:408 start_codon:yes stop_codon:yes gene_type:complete